MQPTYEQLLAENARLRAQVGEPEPAATPDLGDQPPGLTLKMRVKAEAYEYRIYELEVAFMTALHGSPESVPARAAMERVTASYHRDYPGRPLNPKPRPRDHPHAHVFQPMTGPPVKQRKPYTRRVKAAPAA